MCLESKREVAKVVFPVNMAESTVPLYVSCLSLLVLLMLLCMTCITTDLIFLRKSYKMKI